MPRQGRPIRCAIYTRKSTDEGLDKTFNSLDAQREACAAYVMSQQHEGWILMPDLYDDGGFSGGSLERPALQHLLADVRAGKIDVVVVYKIDRLTRSLADFAKIVEVLDAAEASFVSVTQAFSTTTSMGRLTLNVLLSFAQFEREVGAERIRDKVAASKAKGMWMGGVPPLGYEAVDRRLVIVPDEANTVRLIMERYLEASSVRTLVHQLETEGIVSKRRTSRNGRTSGGHPFRRGALLWLLRNPIYIGKVRHRDKIYAGQHDAIVSTDLFDAIQEKLAAQASEGSAGGPHRRVSLLAGMIRDDRDRPMSPVHTRNHGRRYTYYASNMNDDQSAPALRLSAGELELSIRQAITRWLDSPANIASISRGLDAAGKLRLFEAASCFSHTVASAPILETRTHFRRLTVRIDVSIDETRLSFNAAALYDEAGLKEEPHPVKLIIPTLRKSYGHEARLRLEPAAGTTSATDRALVELLGRAIAARDKLLEMHDVEASAMPVTRLRHLQRLARLAYLDPPIIRSILNGSQPRTMQARELWRMADLPLRWAAQRAQLGLASDS